MTVDLALYQPDIAQNTGTLLRLGACLGVMVHIVHPTGFQFSPRSIRRGALDYLEHARFTELHAVLLDHLLDRVGVLALPARDPRDEGVLDRGVHHLLLLAREAAGVPDAVAADADLRIRIPMRQDMRSLNVAVAGSLVLGEALRQTNAFAALT